MDKHAPSVLRLAFRELERIHQLSGYEGDQNGGAESKLKLKSTVTLMAVLTRDFVSFGSQLEQ